MSERLDPIPYLVSLKSQLSIEGRVVNAEELGRLFGSEQFQLLLRIGCRETLALYKQVLDIGTSFVESAASIDRGRRG